MTARDLIEYLKMGNLDAEVLDGHGENVVCMYWTKGPDDYGKHDPDTSRYVYIDTDDINETVTIQ